MRKGTRVYFSPVISNSYPVLICGSQVAAITLYFLLAIAYYIFIAPFLWLNGLVIAAYAVYSPLVRFSLSHVAHAEAAAFDSVSFIAVTE